MGTTKRVFAFIAMAVSIGVIPAAAQRPGRWSVTGAFTVLQDGGLRQGLEGMMVANQFAVPIYGGGCSGCFGVEYFPATDQEMAANLALAYQLRPTLALRLLWGTTTHQPVTIGHGGADFLLNVYHDFRMVAGVISRTSRDGAFRLGVGPAVNFVSSRGTCSGDMGYASQSAHRNTKLGAVLDGGVSVKIRRHTFIDVGYQYRVVGSVVVGPYDCGYAASSSTLTIPQARISGSHSALQLGIGFRL